MTRRTSASSVRRIADATGLSLVDDRPGPTSRVEALLVSLFLAVHVALLFWVASRNSVTFDESFHLAAGVAAVSQGDFTSSLAQPPLARSLYGVAALLAGAHEPDSLAGGHNNERQLGASFLMRNLDRYLRVFLAGRAVAIVLTTALASWLWWEARRRHGATAGLVALAVWCLTPDVLAHGSLVGVDMPTTLVVFGTVLAGTAWLRSGDRHALLCVAAWTAAAVLVRFSAILIVPILLILAVVHSLRGRLAPLARLVPGAAILVVVAWVAINAGYRFQGFGTPLGHVELHSDRFLSVARDFPAVRVPLPTPFVQGLDLLSFLSQPGARQGYFLGQVTTHPDWRYFPVAVGVKWPIGLLALLALAATNWCFGGRNSRKGTAELLIPAAVIAGAAVASGLGYGVRYVLPALPFLIVWVSGIFTVQHRVERMPSSRRWLMPSRMRFAAALALVLLVLTEAARALPYPLSFFNVISGPPGAGERILNDSNVDWGQGLIALRGEMNRRGITRVHLAYHGTTAPEIYGVDYIPYLGGEPGPESDWLAVSSYLHAGLAARVATPRGYTAAALILDTRGLAAVPIAARPAGCMLLWKIR
jgi:hypothetical protein